MDTSVLHMEWLGDEHTMQKVGDSSAGGHEALVFRTKNCVTCGYPVGSLLVLKNAYFLIRFLGFLETKSLPLLKPVLMNPLITANMIVPVQKTITDGLFEPAVIGNL